MLLLKSLPKKNVKSFWERASNVSKMGIFISESLKSIPESLVSTLIGSLGVYILWGYFSQKYSLPTINFGDALILCVFGRLITGGK